MYRQKRNGRHTASRACDDKPQSWASILRSRGGGGGPPIFHVGGIAIRGPPIILVLKGIKNVLCTDLTELAVEFAGRSTTYKTEYLANTHFEMFLL